MGEAISKREREVRDERIQRDVGRGCVRIGREMRW